MIKEHSILDIINLAFFFSSSIFVWANVGKILKDKAIQGVRIMPGVFFSLSTAWGIYYYTALDQPWSVLGMFLLCIANTCWVVFAIHYSRKGENNG